MHGKEGGSAERRPCQAQGESGDLPMPTAEAPQLSKAEAHLHLVATCDRKTPPRLTALHWRTRTCGNKPGPSLALAGIRLQQAASLQAGPCKRGRAQRTSASVTGHKAAVCQLAAAAAQPPQPPPPAEWRDIRRALRRKGPQACMIESSPCLCSRGQQDLVSFAMTSGEQVKAKCGVYTRPLARTQPLRL